MGMGVRLPHGVLLISKDFDVVLEYGYFTPTRFRPYSLVLINTISSERIKMGIFLVLLLASIVIGALSIYFFKNDGTPLAVILFSLTIASAFGLAVSTMGFLFIGIDVLTKSVAIQKNETESIVLSRMLLEDYNSSNLESALRFNQKMKLCKFKQNSFWMAYMNTNGACVDTIAIPDGKFVPTQNIRILKDSTGT